MGRRGRGLPRILRARRNPHHSIGLAYLVSRDLGGVAGYAVGVLHIRTPFVFVPCNLQNAITLPFPVAYECARVLPWQACSRVGLGWPRSRGRSQTSAEARRAGDRRRLWVLREFQTRLAAAVGVPVFSSILGQLPWLLASIPESQRVAVIFAERRSFTRSMQRECGIAISDGWWLPIAWVFPNSRR